MTDLILIRNNWYCGTKRCDWSMYIKCKYMLKLMKWKNILHQLMYDCLNVYFRTCSATTPFFTFHFSFDDFDTFPVKGAIENWDILVCKSNGTSAVVSEPWQYDEIAVTGKLFAKGKKFFVIGCCKTTTFPNSTYSENLV